MPDLHTNTNLSFTDSNHNIKVYADVDAGVIIFEGNRISINPKVTGSIEALERTTDADRKPRIRVRYKKDTNFAGRRQILSGRFAHQFFKEDGTRVSTASTKAQVVSEIVAYLNAEFEKTVASQLAESSLVTYQQYVSSEYNAGSSDGTALKPWTTVQDAVDNATDGDRIYLRGDFTITTPVTLSSTKSLHFYGGGLASVKYASYASTNGAGITQSSTGITKAYTFDGITFSNCGGYAIDIRSSSRTVIENCTATNNGWSGSRLSTTAAETNTWANGGTLGYDSTEADLASFWASTENSDGGAFHVCDTAVVDITDNVVHSNARGITCEDCGNAGAGVIARNRVYNNIGAGFDLASSSGGATPADGDGCENFTVYNNVAKANANSGIRIEGGKNNIVSLNRVELNWSAGVLLSSVSDTRARDMDLDNNNRSGFNGYGVAADAEGSIQISGSGIRSDATYLVEVLDTTIQNTGLGSSTTKNGIHIASDLPAPADALPTSRARIAIDDCSFVSQDYGIVCEDDADDLRLSISDCRFTETGTANVNIPTGAYTEVPFSNIHVDAAALDFSIDATGSRVYVKENAKVIATYGVNQLTAQAVGTYVRVVVKNSQQIQWDSLPVSGLSIDGTSVNSVLNQAVTQLNNLFANATGFASGGDPVVGFALSGDDLTLTLDSGTSYTVDVTTLGVDTDNFVSSGALSGTNLVLTMDDASTVTIDASNMINASQLPAFSGGWYIAYGNQAETAITSAGVVNSIKDNQPFYLGNAIEKGHEVFWTHDDGGDYHLGVWTGGTTDDGSYVDAANPNNWTVKWRFGVSGHTSPDIVANVSGTSYNYPSIGNDIDSRFSNGYALTNNTVLCIRFGNDGYIYLKDATTDEVIGKSNVTFSDDSIQLHMIGQNQPNAKFPVMVERTEDWTIVHDFDNSEDGEWADGLETDTVIRSNITISPGEKMLLNLNTEIQMVPFFSFSYDGGSDGENNPATEMNEYFKLGSNESIYGLVGWSFNTSATHYNSTTNQYQPQNGTPIGMVEILYNSDNSVELYSQVYNEIICTLDVDRDGSAMHLYHTTGGAILANKVPSISKQDISAGSQPLTTFAPDISNQSFDITEGQSFNCQIALDTGSDIATQYVEVDAPSWAVLNQSTGVFNGTAPAYAGTAADTNVINCKAANPVGGVVNFTITLNVVELTYTNTKSLEFGDGDQSYLGGNAALVTALERAANGSGASDAWSISLWYKTSSSNSGQTVLYFGGSDVANDGHIELRQTNHNGAKRIRLRYGSNANHLQLTSPSGSLTAGNWSHILVTYDGGTTGVDSSSMSDYYSRFSIYIDGTLQTTSNTHSNYGYDDEVVGDNYRVGRYSSGQYMKGARVNQLAIWSSDQSANISDIYNGGATQDLSTLTDAPDHYYEIESSTTLIQDLEGTAHFVGYNFDSTDLVTDAP